MFQQEIRNSEIKNKSPITFLCNDICCILNKIFCSCRNNKKNNNNGNFCLPSDYIKPEDYGFEIIIVNGCSENENERNNDCIIKIQEPENNLEIEMINEEPEEETKKINNKKRKKSKKKKQTNSNLIEINPSNSPKIKRINSSGLSSNSVLNIEHVNNDNITENTNV